MLSEQKKAFCREYTIDFNGSAAAKRAGYKATRSRITACELLQQPEIIKEVARLVKERNQQIELTAEKVINELQAIAFAKTTDVVKVKEMTVGKGKTRRKIRAVYVELTSDLDPEMKKAIAEISETRDGIRVKQHDKVKALELLGKHLGIFEKDNQQKKPVVFSDKIVFR